MTKRALLLACANYNDSRLPPLLSPIPDATRLAAALQRPGLGDFETKIIDDPDLVSAQVAIHNHLNDATANDLTLIYLSGHGLRDSAGRFYLALPSTNTGALPATALSGRFMREQLMDTPSRKVVFILDCCFAGAFGRDLVAKSISTADGLPEELTGSCCAVMTASSAIQYALEENLDEGAASVFTRVLADGLITGAADLDGDGLIGLRELFDYVSKEVRERNGVQTPELSLLSASDDLIIARAPALSGRSTVIDEDVANAIVSHHFRLRQAAAEILGTFLHSRDADRAASAKRTLRAARTDSHPDVVLAVHEALAAAPARRRRTLPIQRLEKPSTSSGSWAVVDGASLARIATSICDFTARDEYERHPIGHVLVRLSGSSLRFTATDRFRAVFRTIPTSDAGAPFTVLLSPIDLPSLRAFRKIKNIRIYADDDHVEVVAGSKFLVFNLQVRPDGYPDVTRHLPSGDSETIIEASRVALIEATEELAYIMDYQRDSVVIEHMSRNVDEFRLCLLRHRPESSIRIPGLVRGKRLRVALSPRYLFAALNDLDSSSVQIMFKEPHRPVVLKSHDRGRTHSSHHACKNGPRLVRQRSD